MPSLFLKITDTILNIMSSNSFCNAQAVTMHQPNATNVILKYIYQFVPEKNSRNFKIIGSYLLQDSVDKDFVAVFPLCSTICEYILQVLLNYFLYYIHIECNRYRRGTHFLLGIENKCRKENCSKHLQVETTSSAKYKWFIELDPDFECNFIQSICILPRLLYASVFLK